MLRGRKSPVWATLVSLVQQDLSQRIVICLNSHRASQPFPWLTAASVQTKRPPFGWKENKSAHSIPNEILPWPYVAVWTPTVCGGKRLILIGTVHLRPVGLLGTHQCT